MIRALRTAAAGMFAQQLYVDTIANNLANVNTTAFKKDKVEFQDLLYQSVELDNGEPSGGEGTSSQIQIGAGVQPAAIQKMFSQGDLTPTQNALDIVIEGNGFFQIIRPDDSIAYSRDGTFKLSSDGRIVNSDGFVLEPALSIPQDSTDIQISADGTVRVLLAGEVEPQEVGQIELVRFINPAGLKNLGGNLYEATVSSGNPVIGTPAFEGFGGLRQGYLEMSNVKVVEEMVNMILAQRAYEINSKVIRTAEEMLSTANNLQR